ncbi:MAG: co-chaperone GroES [Erysipelotrichaceae bacterium]|nr:co-chaperone GroES [Erysipelotrichaceae bacterium]
MIRPLFNNVVLKKEKKESKTTSGILLSSKQEESKYAIVVALGDGHLADGKVVNMPLKVGDKVLYSSYSSNEFEENGEKYFVVSLSDIVGIIE